jgi:hypothetical protein
MTLVSMWGVLITIVGAEPTPVRTAVPDAHHQGYLGYLWDLHGRVVRCGDVRQHRHLAARRCAACQERDDQGPNGHRPNRGELATFELTRNDQIERFFFQLCFSVGEPLVGFLANDTLQRFNGPKPIVFRLTVIDRREFSPPEHDLTQ